MGGGGVYVYMCVGVLQRSCLKGWPSLFFWKIIFKQCQSVSGREYISILSFSNRSKKYVDFLKEDLNKKHVEFVEEMQRMNKKEKQVKNTTILSLQGIGFV